MVWISFLPSLSLSLSVRARAHVCVCACARAFVNTCMHMCPSYVLSGCRRSVAKYLNWVLQYAAYGLMYTLPSKSSILGHIEGSHKEIQEQARCAGRMGWVGDIWICVLISETSSCCNVFLKVCVPPSFNFSCTRKSSFFQAS